MGRLGLRMGLRMVALLRRLRLGRPWMAWMSGLGGNAPGIGGKGGVGHGWSHVGLEGGVVGVLGRGLVVG